MHSASSFVSFAFDAMPRVELRMCRVPSNLSDSGSFTMMRKMLLLAAVAMVAASLHTGTARAEEETVRFWDPASSSFQTIVRRTARPMESPIKKEMIDYAGPYGNGTIIVNTGERRLYYVVGDGKALKYGIGVGRPGFTWQGTHHITRKAEWPGWTPPPAMRKRQPKLPYFMPGGPDNPLGARAMYIGSTIYRIHGTAEPWTIGQAVSSGCIRMTNDDVADLYERVGVGTKVVVVH
ncbi:ErfK/YbiS/YcfS/YnhG family [uncultured Pleomorphomonas sp.]|uniref:ErfK/YbiS/YcfS/YnhG family n=2 Tax=uncultured Pleomorphomonas sp. TaxID=442121 RepID=A0A212L689_9HYPH|nr:ErfK/YbiS/YcfS/YnhG family [uncultured Pleomorphomonas sp.]